MRFLDSRHRLKTTIGWFKRTRLRPKTPRNPTVAAQIAAVECYNKFTSLRSRNRRSLLVKDSVVSVMDCTSWAHTDCLSEFQIPERVSKILIQCTSKYELGGAERHLQE